MKKKDIIHWFEKTIEQCIVIREKHSIHASELFIYFAIFFSVRPAFCIVIRQLEILMD